ncbi:transmembrane protein [Streptomyces sp. OM5714]|nr:transmembrane protein [Streptomyces sp. OM5714]
MEGDMASEERSEDRPRLRWQDSLWGIGGTALAVGIGVQLVLHGVTAWPSALVGAVPAAAWIVWWVRRRRVRDAGRVGTEPEDVPAMERRILKGGPAPRDPERRRAMAAFVDSRQERLRRHRWWAFPVLALIFFGTSALWYVSGSVGAGTMMLGLGVVFLGWLAWYNARFDRRLSQMRGRLQG